MLKHILRYPRIYFATVTLIAAFGVVVAGLTAYHGQRATEEQDLITRAQTIAYLLDPREITFLAGDESDRNNPFYTSLKQRFEKLKESNSDVRFIYLTGISTDANVFFYLDSEPEGSPDYSPPGQKYPEASAIFQETFTVGRSRFEGPIADRFGEWVSAFVPVRHPGTEKIIAVLGMDISAMEYRKRMLFAILTPALFITLFWVMLLVLLKSYRKENELLSLKREFISIASHELRSTLTGLSWAVQTLLRDEAITEVPALKDRVVSMERAVQRLLETVAGILDFSRLEYAGGGGLKISPLDLASLAHESVDALELFANEKNVSIAFVGEWPVNLPTSGDREKISRAINNIVSNAVKYSSAGDTVNIAYRKDGENHVVSVANKGQVIEKQDHEKMFSKFFRAGNATVVKESGIPTGRVGTGLGLYFAKQIIEAHGGKIWFESEEDKGTIFYIALPIVK